MSKTTAKTAEDGTSVELIPQPHGGALLAHGMPGNKGGGRPPSELRRRMRGSLAERVQIAEEIADDKDANARDRLKALDFLARYGLGQLTELSVEDVQDRLAGTIRVIRTKLPDDEALELLEEIRPLWA